MSSIGSATSAPPAPPVQPPQAAPVRDADGDNDGTKAVAPKSVPMPVATSGSVGTRVNTMA